MKIDLHTHFFSAIDYRNIDLRPVRLAGILPAEDFTINDFA
jgi:hypothetical protein